MAESNPFFARNVEYSVSRICGHLFIGERDQTRTVTFPHPKGDCIVCTDESGLKMGCGHYVCPDDILDWAWEQLRTMKHEIRCPECEYILKQDDIIKFGLPKTEEKLFLLTAITTNFCESQDIQECPKCQTLCQRTRTDNPQVHCTVCAKKRGNLFMFCWYCMREWNNTSNDYVCGNAKCKREIIEKLMNSPKMVISDIKGNKLTIPKMRACPKCHTLLEHSHGCNMFTCGHCGLEFCFICLTNTSGGSLICKSSSGEFTGILCTPAPIQTKLR